MRRYQKKRLKEKFQYLHDGHQLIAESLVSNRNISSLLTECQRIAIEIGNGIEECEGAGTKAVTILEQYCELLYSFSIKTLKTKSVKYAVSVKKKLEELISEAEKSMEQDIIVETEVVFFPYKASMWDSMETVWRKCMEDNNTRCIVVPLPYYIKDNNGKKVKKCYEGADFPAEVEITDYEQYLKENHYSDIAIYHNPYDAINKITEVDSRFFTSEYHKYADTLVYIPYYVLIYEPSAGFILAPGVKNADYVILQDNETVNAFLKWYPNQQNKFLPLGSPKIEKAIQMNAVPREELDIPQEWKDRIRGKKVLFYNTHLVNFMDKKRDFTGKLKSVFETMQKQEDIVLWWRPHPLSEDMEYSTDKERFREYEELVEWYRSENIGIYDDTPKLHEAIAASDAYYGDESSLIKLFQAVDKPVMVQNSEKIDLDKIRLVERVCCIGKNLWYTSCMHNGLFNIDLITGENKFVGYIPNEELEMRALYQLIVPYKRKLVLIPYNASAIAVYDIDTNEFKKCKLGEMPYEKCYSAHLYKDMIYLLPQSIDCLYCYSIADNCIKRIDNESFAYTKWTKDKWISISGCILNDKLYFIIYNTNKICEYDLKQNTFNILEIVGDEDVLLDVVTVKNGLFVVSNTTPYAKYWCPSSNCSFEFILEKTYELGALNVCLDKVYYTPLYSSESYVFDVDSGRMWKECICTEKSVGVARQIQDRLCFLPVAKDGMFYFTNGDMIKTEDDFFIDREKEKNVSHEIIYENEQYNLAVYMKYLSEVCDSHF